MKRYRVIFRNDTGVTSDVVFAQSISKAKSKILKGHNNWFVLEVIEERF